MIINSNKRIKLNNAQIQRTYTVHTLKEKASKNVFATLKEILIYYNMIVNLISLLSIFYINYIEKLRIYYGGIDVTIEVSLAMCIVNILLIWLMVQRLVFTTLGWSAVIINSLLNMGNLFGGTYMYKLWNWFINNHKDGIQLKYYYSIEYKWTMQEKMDYCDELCKKYPQLQMPDKQNIAHEIGNTKMENIPKLIEYHNEKRLNIIKEIAKKANETNANNTNTSTTYEQLENIKQVLISLFYGTYWYIGWGLLVSISLLVYINKAQQQPEFYKKDEIDRIIHELKRKVEDTNSPNIQKLTNDLKEIKQKVEHPTALEIERYWNLIRKDPSFVKKLAGDIYKTPCVRRKVKDPIDGITIYKERSPFDVANESNDIQRELAQIWQQEAQESSNSRTKLGTELHDLAIKCEELKKLYEKTQPRIDQIEMKLNSKLINVAKEILDEIK